MNDLTTDVPNAQCSVGQRDNPQRRAVRRLRNATARQTPLDRWMINAVVDAQKGVVGAMTERELISAVDEFIRLNERRHQSYFHAGFRDALLERPFDADMRVETERRARWYWAGAIVGMSRSKSWGRMVEVYESTETVRALGDGHGQASVLAGVEVTKALWSTGRTSDLHLFVSERLARTPPVFRLLLEAGTDSLRSRSPVVARTVFDLLLRVGESFTAEDSLSEDMLTVRRRMAHCLRLLDEHQRAVDLLQRLLNEESDPGIQAMVHADLGLMQGRFGLLDEVRIPSDEAERKDLVARLEVGEKHYVKAVVRETAYASHGHYCLGVLWLAQDGKGEERFAEADKHLEKAHAEIRSNRDYPESLLAQIDLYLGIAKSQLLDNAAEVRHAARLIVSGVKGAEIPSHFVEPMVASLVCFEEGIEMVAGPLIESGSDKVLDALANTEILETYPPIAEGLHKRANRPNRRKSLAAADLRRALQGYLGVGDVDRAQDVLDELEQHAFEDFGAPEFLQILCDQDRYGPAWNHEDAAIASARCLEAMGDFAEALAVLRKLFHKYVSRSEFLNALSVLEQIEAYGLESEEYVDLTRRYDQSKPVDDPVIQDVPAEVRVLVVGGNETQERNARQVAFELAARDPQVTPEFVHTGWGSNWNQFLGPIEAQLAICDAVVVMRFIRTGLGRHVRAMCRERNIPWRACVSGGQKGQVEAIRTVAGVARQMRQRE